MKKFTSLFLAVILLFSLTGGLVPALALDEKDGEPDEKKQEHPDFTSEEVIYAVISTSGSVEDMYSVCLIDSDKEREVSYFGPFKEVENLTDVSEIELSGDEATINMQKGKFYFKSVLSSKKLPWFFDISYKLDGEEISGESLGGKSGLLEINLKSRANEDVDESFRNGFFMQISIIFDAEKTESIEAGDATVANVGGEKLLTLFGIPGKDLDATITAEVENFEMPGISIAAVPFSMADQLGEIDDLTDGLTQLSNAVGALSAGAGQLAGGIDELKDGSSEFGEGLMLLSQNSATLRDGSAQVLDAVNHMSKMLEDFSSVVGDFDLSSLAFLPATLIFIADNLDAAADKLESIPGGLSEAIDALGAAINNIPGVDEGSLAELIANNPDNAALAQLVACYEATKALKEVWNNAMGNIQVSGGNADVAAALRGQAAKLREAAAAIQSKIDSGDLGSVGDITKGLCQFANTYGQLHNGIVEYTQGVDTLAANWGELYGGVTQLSDGASRLSGGLGQLSAGTSGVSEKIEELMGDLELGEYEPLSYLSEKNKSCTLVQFVIMTDPIKAPEETKPELAPEPETSFFDRLLAIFKPDKETAESGSETESSK